jgi:putative redox protein
MDAVIRSGEGLLQEIDVGPHHFRSDEPVEMGGAGLAPTPYELISAALGACTAMTLRMYARTKGWPLTGVTVTVRHDKIHARDCAECEVREGRIDRMERAIALEGPLDEAQRQRLLQMADRCPVHRTLESKVHIVTVLAR